MVPQQEFPSVSPYKNILFFVTLAAPVYVAFVDKNQMEAPSCPPLMNHPNFFVATVVSPAFVDKERTEAAMMQQEKEWRSKAAEKSGEIEDLERRLEEVERDREATRDKLQEAR